MDSMEKLSERGAVAAEFALLLPVILTILFGIMEFGMIMYGREVVTNATREGVRHAIIMRSPLPDVSPAEAEAVATTYLAGTSVNPANVTFLSGSWGGPTGNPVTLTATYHYSWLIPYIPTVLGLPSPFDIPLSVTMLHE
jgi:Flp pilus assembly protein TadG